MYHKVRIDLFRWAVYADDGGDVLHLWGVYDREERADWYVTILNRAHALRRRREEHMRCRHKSS